MLVVAVGVPGVGKTSVIKRVQEILEENGIKSQVINFGDVMKEILANVDREKMRKLPVEEQRKAQMEAARRINEIAKAFDGITFVDTHIFIRTTEGYMSGLPSRVLEERGSDLKAIIVITADPRDIRKRRQRDSLEGKRVREEYAAESEEVIAMHQQITINGAVVASVMYGPLLIIAENEEGRLDKAAKLIANNLINAFRRSSRCLNGFYFSLFPRSLLLLSMRYYASGDGKLGGI